MKNRLFGCCTLVCLATLYCKVECYGEILYDDLQDDVEVLSFKRLGNSSLEKEQDGLSFVSSQASGGVAIGDAEGPFSASDGWSIRARFTIDEVLGLGLAGIGVEFPRRWAGVLGASHDEEFGVGEGNTPQKSAIAEGEIVDDPFVVQLDAFGDSLTGHFWRPKTPTDVETIRYRSVRETPVAPRLANNGTATTYHAIWVSRSPLPLPTGFEDQGDLNGNKILEVGDIDLLQQQIRGTGAPEFDLNLDGAVDNADLVTLVEDYLGTRAGDTNLDDRVDFSDFLVLSERFGTEGSWQDGDFDSDGRVGFPDFLALSQNFAGSPNAVAAVPEPSAALLTVCGLFGVINSRRRKRSPTEQL